jgi:hypothetical protein
MITGPYWDKDAARKYNVLRRAGVTADAGRMAKAPGWRRPLRRA